MHDEADAFGPLAVGPAEVVVAVGEFQGGRAPHEQGHPPPPVMDRLDQGAAHRSGGPQIVLLLQQEGGAGQFLAAHGGYFQLPEHHGGRVLGKHAFDD